MSFNKVVLPEDFAKKKIILCKEDPFFISPQGEGGLTGTLSAWVRSSTCNLKCAWDNGNGTVTLCDTAYTSHKPERHIKTTQEVFDKAMDNNAPYVVFTGGEPSSQKNFTDLIDYIEDSGKNVTIETNATKFFASKATMISMSPKLLTSSHGLKVIAEDGNVVDTEGFLRPLDQKFDSEMQTKIETRYEKFYEAHNNERYKLEEMKKFMEYYGPKRYQFKFVINTEQCVEEVMKWYVEPLDIPMKSVWFMPQGMTAEMIQEKANWVVEQCKKHGANYSDRVHVRIWGNQTGV